MHALPPVSNGFCVNMIIDYNCRAGLVNRAGGVGVYIEVDINSEHLKSFSAYSNPGHSTMDNPTMLTKALVQPEASPRFPGR